MNDAEAVRAYTDLCRRLADAVLKRHVMEPQHSHPDHDCEECRVLADLRDVDVHVGPWEKRGDGRVQPGLTVSRCFPEDALKAVEILVGIVRGIAVRSCPAADDSLHNLRLGCEEIRKGNRTLELAKAITEME